MRIVSARGVLMAVGKDLDSAVVPFAAAISAEAAASRSARDGDAYHITLVSKKELAELTTTARKALATQAAELLPRAGLAGLVCLGVGAAARGENKAWFVALLWPALQLLRQQAGLAPNAPHITLGFDGTAAT